MVQCVRHFVLPRLKKDAGLPFFFPLITHSQPLISETYHFHKRP